jgi:hypothetical protein
MSTTTQTIAGVTCPINPEYPAVVQPGQNGYPGPEDGPKAVPPGCAFGLPTIDFSAGPWQPYPPSAKG